MCKIITFFHKNGVVFFFNVRTDYRRKEGVKCCPVWLQIANVIVQRLYLGGPLIHVVSIKTVMSMKSQQAWRGHHPTWFQESSISEESLKLVCVFFTIKIFKLTGCVGFTLPYWKYFIYPNRVPWCHNQYCPSLCKNLANSPFEMEVNGQYQILTHRL